ERGLTKRDELGSRSHRADGEPRPLGRAELVARLPGDAGGQPVEFPDLLYQAELGHHDLVGAEAVGLDAVASDGQKAFVDLAHDVRAGLTEDFRAVFKLEVVAQRKI